MRHRGISPLIAAVTLAGALCAGILPAVAGPVGPNAPHGSRSVPAGTVPVPVGGGAVNTSHPNHVIGHGTPGSCTSAKVVAAVRAGGIITFNCGPKPVTITMRHTAKVLNTRHRIVLDGGGKVTLSGNDKRRILYMNTCDKRQVWTTSDCYDQKWPQLVVQNITFEDGNSQVKQTPTSNYGGGAIFEEGGRLKVVNSRFLHNRCYKVGPDLGGAAIRALAQWHNLPIFITRDTFRGGRCSNGSALSSIGVSWTVTDSRFVDNDAIGHGANPASKGTPGGGSGGAIYMDGDTMTLLLQGTTMQDNDAKEGGGAIFFVSDDNTGSATISHSTLHHNLSNGFQTQPGIYYQSYGHKLKVIKSTIN
ncbi:MAG TPA: hypothetical protein VME70_16460 [Mycobacteriales bacterium]|nr:hypothetical protein [Mycobacteriales bacterium]